ncbi:MAG TPA: flagellar hook protein FlgE [Stellaceae bacterium]|nr:flagellar hook protein FlgE [Stellaceae bacterium]
MSIFGALYSAVSGLNANSQALDMIADNISNSNTPGYKETQPLFSTLVTQDPTETTYTPGGVQVSPFSAIDQQGLLQASTSPTSLAIQGGGFFVVNNNAAGASANGAFSFTRAGAFTIDANGNLRNSAGLYLQGQALTAAQAQAIQNGDFSQLTATSLTSLETVNVNGLSGTAQASANVTLAANLPASDTTASPARTVTVPVYDSLGNEHDLTLSFTRTATANQWQVAGSLANAGASTVTIAGGDDIVQFNPDGTLNAAGTTFNAANALSIAWDPGVTGATTPQTLNFNLGSDGQADGLGQFGGPFSVSRVNQDGLRYGNFTGINVDQNGIVTANFDNGEQRPIFIIPVATFQNPDGLAAQTGNTYLQTDNSGGYLLRQSGTGAAGQIAPSALEGSTVDIATEFSNLIITQRAYSANAKVITTSDEMLQELIDAKR